MKVGTKSILHGAHCFFIHPWFVAWAWWKLYGFPKQVQLWVAFFVHDLGYLGKPNMDGREGENHPLLGARIIKCLFPKEEVVGHEFKFYSFPKEGNPVCSKLSKTLLNNLLLQEWKIVGAVEKGLLLEREVKENYWYTFTLYHSRFLAKKHQVPYSRLCVADKLAISLTPWWIYLPMARSTGEIKEYRSLAEETNPGTGQSSLLSDKEWYRKVQRYCLRWAVKHRYGRDDEWTTKREVSSE